MNKTRKNLWLAIPFLIFAFGLYSIFIRFYKGLGASTNLSDQFPWGLWIGFDVLSGVALAAGAFTISAAVYVLHLDQYKSLVRPAILTGFIGYLLVIIALMFDLGHPYRIWHPLVMWNPHSVMFEISWCVTLYTTVLTLEFSIFVFEKFNWKRALKIVHSIMIPLVILGVILSTLHQSSLGSLFLIVPYKLHALWYSPWLPILFFLSALALGCAMVIVESFISSIAFNRELEIDILSDLGRVLLVVLWIYGIARFIDLNDREIFYLAFQPGFEHFMFWPEVLLALLCPIFLLSIWRVRKNRLGLFMSALMVVVGFILNRFNVSMTGLVRISEVKYIPSWMEISVTLALVMLGITLFAWVANYLKIFPPAKPCLAEGETCYDKKICCLPTAVKFIILIVWFMAIGLIYKGAAEFKKFEPQSITYRGYYEKSGEQKSLTTDVFTSSVYINLPKDIFFKQSPDSPGRVKFSHEYHVPAVTSCRVCHSEKFRILAVNNEDREERDMHSKEYCGSCHDIKTSIGECTLCHVN